MKKHRKDKNLVLRSENQFKFFFYMTNFRGKALEIGRPQGGGLSKEKVKSKHLSASLIKIESILLFSLLFLRSY